MRIQALNLEGAHIIDLERFEDERGFFARAWCSQELEEHGLDHQVVQANVSMNAKAGTVRGMHFQVSPYEETKFVRCTAGRMYDVIVDIRSDSPTYLQWLSVELSADNHRTLYIPKGFAHGFQTLEDDTEVFYLHTEYYHPQSAGGYRWDDPRIAIDWPIPEPSMISEKDKNWPLL